jgi:hypothetical protein
VSVNGICNPTRRIGNKLLCLGSVQEKRIRLVGLEYCHGAEARHWIITAHPSNRFVTIHHIPTACFMDVSDKQPKTNNEID